MHLQHDCTLPHERLGISVTKKCANSYVLRVKHRGDSGAVYLLRYQLQQLKEFFDTLVIDDVVEIIEVREGRWS